MLYVLQEVRKVEGRRKKHQRHKGSMESMGRKEGRKYKRQEAWRLFKTLPHHVQQCERD